MLSGRYCGNTGEYENHERHQETAEIKPYSQEIYEDILPAYLSIGVTYERFMDSCPKELEPFLKAHNLRKNEKDIENWQLGQYIASSIACVLSDKKYPKEPMFQIKDEVDLSDEQIYEQELKKALFIEEQWIMAEKQKGLPETII